MRFFIGQRVIIRHESEIATVIRPSDTANADERRGYTWIKTIDGHIRYYANDNLKPLPGGQL